MQFAGKDSPKRLKEERLHGCFSSLHNPNNLVVAVTHSCTTNNVVASLDFLFFGISFPSKEWWPTANMPFHSVLKLLKNIILHHLASDASFGWFFYTVLIVTKLTLLFFRVVMRPT